MSLSSYLWWKKNSDDFVVLFFNVCHFVCNVCHFVCNVCHFVCNVCHFVCNVCHFVL